MLAWARLPEQQSFEGDSLLGLLDGKGGKSLTDRVVFAMPTLRPVHYAVIQSDWKAIIVPQGASELYDLATRHHSRAPPARVLASLDP
jgi:hypothetical protein